MQYITILKTHFMSYIKPHTQGGYRKQKAGRYRLSTMPCKCHKTPTWISHIKEALYKPNEKLTICIIFMWLLNICTVVLNMSY